MTDSPYRITRTAMEWEVWHEPSITRLSSHKTGPQAKAALARYEAADRRRADLNKIAVHT